MTRQYDIVGANARLDWQSVLSFTCTLQARDSPLLRIQFPPYWLQGLQEKGLLLDDSSFSAHFVSLFGVVLLDCKLFSGRERIHETTLKYIITANASSIIIAVMLRSVLHLWKQVLLS